jgi:ubiquitin-conjugating enzyme E2 S
MVTKIFHPNVSSAGEICVNTLKKDWKAEYGILHILTTIKCLLIYPNPESALDEEAGKLLLEDYQEYCARAKIVTQVHARVKPAEFADAGPSSSKAETAPVASSSGSASSASAPTSIPPSISLTTAPPTTSHTPRAVSSSYSHGGSAENEPSAGTILQLKPVSKEGRHPSPAPLGQGGNVGLGTDSSMANASANVPEPGAGASTDLPAKPVKIIKAVKRTAAPPAMTNAEKRKRALKRL